MKATTVILFLATIAVASCYYARPNLPSRQDQALLQAYRNYLLQQQGSPSKRCANLFDEGCANGGSKGAGSDDSWLNGHGNNPGKRCANLFDESCINTGMNGAGSDDDWLNGGGSPGKR